MIQAMNLNEKVIFPQIIVITTDRAMILPLEKFFM